MIGSVASDGKTVTLTSGSLPAWDGTVNTLAGAQAFGYQGATAVTGAGAVISSVIDSTHFVLSVAGTASITGVKFVLSQVWTAALARIQANVTPNNPVTSGALSAGVGYLGGDGWMSCDLGPCGANGVLWMMDDSWWATASGKTRAQSTFERPLMVQSGSAAPHTFAGSGQDTLTWYESAVANLPWAGVSNPPFDYGWFPNGALAASAHALLIIGASASDGQTGSGKTEGWWISNPATGTAPTAPGSWTKTYLTDLPWTERDTPFCNWIDPGDGYLYNISTYDGGANLWRWPKSDLAVGAGVTPTFKGVQFWLGPGIGWVGGARFNDRGVPLRSRQVPLVKTGGNWAVNGMGFYRKSGGDYVLTTNLLNVPMTACFAISTPITGPFTTFLPFYVPPVVAGWVHYGAFSHPEQTWQGKSTDDIFITYDTNGGLPSDMTTAWTIPLRVTGI